ISRRYHFACIHEPLVMRREHEGNLEKQIPAMHRHQMRVAERAFQDDPIDRGNSLLRRRSLAYIHFDAGEGYFALGNYGPAFRHLLRSVTLWPFEYRYHAYLTRVLIKQIIPWRLSTQ